LYCCQSRPGASTLVNVAEHDWLERGHGGGEGLQPMIKGSARRATERVSIRGVLRGGSPVRRRSRRRTKALVGWLLYCCTAVGGTAAAFTVRDTLFPSLGAPTTRSLWVSTHPDTTLVTDPSSSSSEKVDTLEVESTVATTVAASIEDHNASSVSPPGDGSNGANTTNSVDDHGSGRGNVPETGTTLAGSPSSGPSGPVTTVDNHGGTSTPSTPSSASTPPASVDPQPTAASVPGSATTDTSAGHQSGKGGGTGGGSSGGPPPAP
jgi:hypothetical protein